MDAWLAVGACLLLAASALLVLLAPRAMPRSYSWISNTISESAAQGVPRAWIARSGFVGLGSGAVLASLACSDFWGVAGSILVGAFGVLIMCTAWVSEKPWVAGVAYDINQARLHSIAAGTAGVLYTCGVVVVLLADDAAPLWLRAVTLVAALSAVVLPVAMALQPRRAGMYQRAMFGLCYAWLLLEVSRGL